MEADKGTRQISHLETRVLFSLAKKKKLDVHIEISASMAEKFVKWGFAEWITPRESVGVTRKGINSARFAKAGVEPRVPR